MNFYDRYMAGETTAVYDDIDKLTEHALSFAHRHDVEKVLNETFQRVAYNLKIIYQELLAIGYVFNANDSEHFLKPLHPPLKNTEQLLQRLDRATEGLGFVPLSLQYFYRTVGGVNFVWDYENNADLMWALADPLQILSLDALVEYIDHNWQQDMHALVLDNPKQSAYLDISADDLHKDNISGGQPYAIALTEKPSVDSLVLFEYHNTAFIDYLRLSFKNCGFINITREDCENDYQPFFDQVKPQLRPL